MQKMITEIIVVLLLVCGSWIGSDFNTKHQLAKLPPKVQNITQIQNVDNVNTSIQSSEQAQLTTTIITGRTNLTLSLNYKGNTNITHSFSSRTNKTCKTN